MAAIPTLGNTRSALSGSVAGTHLVSECSEAQFHLEEYEAAKASFEEAAAADSGSAAVKKWLSKCDAQLEGGPHPASKGSVQPLEFRLGLSWELTASAAPAGPLSQLRQSCQRSEYEPPAYTSHGSCSI